MIGEAILKHLLLIGDLADADRQAVLDLPGEVRSIRRGEDVLREGDHPNESVVVLAGLLQRYKMSPDGRRQIHSLYLPTDTPSFETLPMEVVDNNVGAIAPSRIGIVHHDDLCRLIDEHPKVRMLIWRETLVQGAIFREWLMRNSQMLAHVQMAHFFCEMMLRARAAGIAQGNSCDLPITQEDLADALGVTPVHVNRTLMVLRAGGLVEFQKGRLTIADWPKFAEIAEFDASYLHLERCPEAQAS